MLVAPFKTTWWILWIYAQVASLVISPLSSSQSSWVLNRFLYMPGFTKPSFINPTLDGVLPVRNVFRLYEKRQTVLIRKCLITWCLFVCERFFCARISNSYLQKNFTQPGNMSPWEYRQNLSMIAYPVQENVRPRFIMF